MKAIQSKFIPLCIAGVIILLNFSSILANEISFETIQLDIAGKTFNLEVANTPQKRQRGLMYRENLGARAGMLFIYSSPADIRIWMKNTLIPLTVVWLDAKARVIDIKKLLPCRQQECPVYGVDRASKYIIELNAEYNELKPGDYIPAVLSL